MTASGGASVSHDARGNITAIGSASYAYSAENRLGVSDMGIYISDAMGRMFFNAAQSQLVRYDGVDRIGEYDNATGAVKRRYVHGPGMDEPLVWYEGSGTSDRRWLHADERGSIVAVTNGAGTAIAVNSYDEYGVPASGNVGRFGYTGQVWLPELGAYYYKARIYNPALGRFMQTDPIGYGDGLNLYAYVKGDPVNYADPLGLEECPAGGAGTDCDVTVKGKGFSNPAPTYPITMGTSGVIWLPSFIPDDMGGVYEGEVVVTALPSRKVPNFPTWTITGQPNPCMVALGQGAWNGIFDPEALIGDMLTAGAFGAANAGKVASAALPVGRALSILRASGAGFVLGVGIQGTAGAIWAYFSDARCK